jgi:hypothetical protein
MLQVTETVPGDFCRRCVGRQAIERSIRALMLRTQRFGRHRLQTDGGARWAARLAGAIGAAGKAVTHGNE